MGDRYVWEEKCPKCKGGVVDCAYTESCLISHGICNKCSTYFDILQHFELIEKKEKKHV